MFKQALSLALLSTVASVASISYAGSAHAIDVKVAAGSSRGSLTNEGAFSSHLNDPNYQTFDFNQGTAPNTEYAQYSFSNPNYSTTAYSEQTGIYSDKWAPAGAKGEDNASNYLAVFSNSAVTIQAKGSEIFNYFGFDAGALSEGNTIEFFNGDTLIKKLDYAAMNLLAPVANAQQGGQLNGFFEFFSQGNDDNFNKIVLSQVGGGGFESDNHTFHIGTGAHTSSVPEPGVILGLVGVGGMFLRKRKLQSYCINR